MSNLLEAKNLKKYFTVPPKGLREKPKSLRAVDGVSFSVRPCETLGVVGESGCGKSTLGKTLLRLHEKTDGEVWFKDREVFSLDAHELKDLRRHMQMVFQDPFSCLNPRRRVEDIIAQPLRVGADMSKSEMRDRVEELMRETGLDPRYRRRYPHQFSGGQRQRVGIARAMALNPELVICDESVSALDVSIQAQILNLLRDLQKAHDLTYIFIAHDLSVVEFIADRIMVMYLGRVVELADKKDMVDNPLHPYTRSLFAASPGIDPRKRDLEDVILGDVPSPINPPAGCHFHPRCPKAMDVCREVYPEIVKVGGTEVRCHLYS